MSELKAYELKYGAYGMYLAEDGHKVDDNFVNLVYPKAETDKVIAELEESHKKEVEQLLMEIVKLKGDYKEACDRLHTAGLIKDEPKAKAKADIIEEAGKKYQGLVPLVYDIETMGLDEARPQDMPYAVYLKREADKVIEDLEESHKIEVEQLLIEIAELKKENAELKKKINEAQTELELWRDGSIISEAHQKELDGKRHSDYKRCVAMAMWCEEAYNRECGLNPEEMTNKEFYKQQTEFWPRWNSKWIKIAEQFKEAK